MRIGILTLKPSINLGGIMQAYALQTVLERMGHEVVVVVMPYTLPTWKKPLCYAKRALNKYVLMNKNQRVFVEKYNESMNIVLMEHTRRFINKYLHILSINKPSQLNAKDFDAFVVGSDQIWRPGYFPKIEITFLSFTKKWKVKRLSYAASFGTDEWEYTAIQTRICSKLLQRFDAVSVREDSGVELCKRYLKTNATHVLDPTLLLKPQDYRQIFKENDVSSNIGNLFVYILDETPQKNEIINLISKERSLRPFIANAKVQDINAPIKDRIQLPVEQWLKGFSNADFVVCDSFHGAVFSIVFNKSFVVIPNPERGNARFHSLLKAFGLEDRLLEDNDIFAILSRNIDWKDVNNRWEILRAESIKFLKSELF